VADIVGNLPGHNCGACGAARCDLFAEELWKGSASLADCPVLLQERYGENRTLLQAMLAEPGSSMAPSIEAAGSVRPNRPVGLIDGYEADFVLVPLRGESSCREILLPLTPGNQGAGDVIRYRPLGCPITHFARIIESKDGLLAVHIVGPRHRLDDRGFVFSDVGLCMVIGFEGDVEGALPFVGQTVRFMPAECMMQKVHSGVVVNCEGRTVRIEGLDLKVWAPPVRA
jgi:uncharacterized Fe-S cluster-containing protein